MAAVRGGAPVEDVLRNPLHLGETGVDTDRTGARQAEFDAVVPGRIVRGREHRAGSVEAARAEVHQVGGGQPQIDDVETVFEQAVAERRQQLRAGRAHVAGDDHPVGAGRLHENCEPDAQRVCDLDIELIGHGPSDVVGLDDGGQR